MRSLTIIIGILCSLGGSKTLGAMDFETRKILYTQNKQIPCPIDFVIKINGHMRRYCIFVDAEDNYAGIPLAKELLVYLAKDLLISNPADEVSGTFLPMDIVPSTKSAFKLTAKWDTLVMFESL